MEKKLKNYTVETNCPVRSVLDRIGDKWSILVLLLLHDHTVLRFNELHRSIGTVSQKMLTVTLKSLESDGLVTRTVYPEIPPRVEYALTDRGKSLVPLIDQLAGWANEHMAAIQESRKRYANAS